MERKSEEPLKEVADEKISVTALCIGNSPYIEYRVEGRDEAELGHPSIFYPTRGGSRERGSLSHL